MENKDYYELKYPSFSSLKHFITGTPWHFKEALENKKPPTDAMQLGSALHLAILEPKKFTSNVIFKHISKPSKEECEGKILIKTEKQYDKLMYMIEAIKTDTFAKYLLNFKGGNNEVEHFWSEKVNGIEINLKCKVDRYIDLIGCVIDIKTISDISNKGISKALGELLYVMQLPMYAHALSKVTSNHIDEQRFIFVDSNTFMVRHYKLPQHQIDLGIYYYRTALEMLSNCMKKNSYPFYPEEDSIEISSFIANKYQYKIEKYYEEREY